MIRNGSTRRLARRARPPLGREHPILVALPGGGEGDAGDSAESWTGLYVRRPRDGGYAARWAAVLASANGDIWARDREPRVAQRRLTLLRRRTSLLRP